MRNITSTVYFLACVLTFFQMVSAEDVVTHALEQKTVGYYSVMLPPDYDSEAAQSDHYPVCILVHGSGGSEQSYVKLVNEHLGRDGVIYLTARAPHPKYSKFFESKQAGFTVWPEFVYEKDRQVAVAPSNQPSQQTMEKLYTQWIHDCLQDVRAKYRCDDEKVVLLGHSQGAAFAFRFAVDYPQLVKSCFLYAGYYESRLTGSTSGDFLRAYGVTIWVQHNEDDPIIPVQSSVALVEYLKANDVEYAEQLYPDGGHGFREDAKVAASAFIDQWCREGGHHQR